MPRKPEDELRIDFTSKSVQIIIYFVFFIALALFIYTLTIWILDDTVPKDVIKTQNLVLSITALAVIIHGYIVYDDKFDKEMDRKHQGERVEKIQNYLKKINDQSIKAKKNVS